MGVGTEVKVYILNPNAYTLRTETLGISPLYISVMGSKYYLGWEREDLSISPMTAKCVWCLQPSSSTEIIIVLIHCCIF